MSDMITIENTEMQIREYNGQRVVTFKDIDTAHHNKDGITRRSFSRNKKHFIEGEDYFVLNKANSNGTNCPIRNITIPNKGITVLTESGYLLIAKSFTDDLSWEVQRQLVNAYFKAKAQSQTAVAPAQVEDAKYNTSNTLVPKVKSWYIRNRSNLEWVAYKTNCKLSYVCHRLLKRIGEEYDLEAAKKIYEEETGYAPQYPLDIVDYFPQLSAMATWWLNDLIKVIEEENKGD